ncbi:reverse transcriptase domain-containing protein [Tanacetum coccineum]
MDQEKTTFTCPFGTYAYRRMPFGLYNAPTTFQRCMLAIFHDMIKESVKVFMDDFSVFGSSFDHCLNNLDKMLQRCKDAHLVLNWEKCHFMVKEGIVLGHKVSEAGLEVDKAKIDIISKLAPPTNIKGIRSFLGHASFYRRFIKDFSKIACPLTKFLEKDTPFEFNDECINTFKILKEKLTYATIEIVERLHCDYTVFEDLSMIFIVCDEKYTPITTPSTSQPPLSSPSRVPTPPHDLPLPGGHTPGSNEGSMILNELMVLCTKLSTTVASLEQDLKQTKKVYSNAYTKLIMRVKKLEHKGRRIAEIDQYPSISLVQDEGASWIQEDAEIQGRTSTDTEILLDQEKSTKLVGDLGSGEKVYIRRSAEKRKDKGKAIMKEDESINEEERQRIARDAEIAKQLQEEFDRARQEQEVVAEVDQAYDTDWSDPAVLRYHALQNRSFFDFEIEKEVMKRPGFDFQQKSNKKRLREDSDEDNAKKQKLEDDAEKEELRDSMDVVLRDDIAIDVESLATKYPIVDWKTHVLTENMMYYQIIRADGSSKNYKVFSEMLDDFDRQDVMDLYRLVQESTGVAIHMMIEKKYPLTQEMLSRMLSRRLEVDHESEMAYELLRFIRSQLQK